MSHQFFSSPRGTSSALQEFRTHLPVLSMAGSDEIDEIAIDSDSGFPAWAERPDGAAFALAGSPVAIRGAGA